MSKKTFFSFSRVLRVFQSPTCLNQDLRCENLEKDYTIDLPMNQMIDHAIRFVLYIQVRHATSNDGDIPRP